MNYIEEINQNYTINNMNLKLTIGKLLGKIEINGMNNKIEIENNYGKIKIHGMKNKIIIINNYNNHIEDSGLKNKVTFSNQMTNNPQYNYYENSYSNDSSEINEFEELNSETEEYYLNEAVEEDYDDEEEEEEEEEEDYDDDDDDEEEGTDEKNKKESCPICFIKIQQNKKPALKLHCGHSFHIDCLTKWGKKNNNCPLCRRNLNN